MTSNVRKKLEKSLDRNKLLVVITTECKSLCFEEKHAEVEEGNLDVNTVIFFISDKINAVLSEMALKKIQRLRLYLDRGCACNTYGAWSPPTGK